MYPKERNCHLNKKEELGMIIKKKKVNDRNKMSNVFLKKEDDYYIVKVDGVVYKKSANELFSVQVFNAI